jgi:TonB family protein
LNNIAVYSLQLGLVVALSTLVAALLPIRAPGARLAFWQLLLGAGLVLPLIRPWAKVTGGGVTVSTSVRAIAPGQTSAWPALPPILWMLLVTGMLLRFAWLALGLLRLHSYKLRSQALEGQSTSTVPAASIRISDEISSPVTFGFFRPVVLLPKGFEDLTAPVREAILAHELLHVRRRDWLFTVAEETIRAVLWFHPAIWWLLGEIQLAREQVVDHAVIRMTGSREKYVDALLAVAGAKPQLDLSPAPLFLRRRHLKQRVVSILKEVSVNRRKSISALAAGVGFMVAMCWFVTGAIPLTAQDAPPPPKIRVGGNVQQANLVNKTVPAYPAEAKEARIQGTVTLDVEIAPDGKVRDISLVSGPPELVQSAIDAVKQWVYKPTLLNGQPVAVVTTVEVNYTLSQ